MDKLMVTTIYVIRHGESHANVRSVLSNGHVYNAGLTPQGRLQSINAANWLQIKHLEAVYSSSLRRSLETADILGDVVGCLPRTCDDVREIDVGVFDGRGDRRMWRDHDRILARWYRGEVDVSFPGGETFRQAEKRIVGAILGMSQRHLHAEIGVVTHNMVARFAVARLAPFSDQGLSDPVYGLAHGEIGVLRLDSGQNECLAWGIDPVDKS